MSYNDLIDEEELRSIRNTLDKAKSTLDKALTETDGNPQRAREVYRIVLNRELDRAKQLNCGMVPSRLRIFLS